MMSSFTIKTFFMRKIFFFTVGLLFTTTVIFFNACKRDISPGSSNNGEIAVKVNSWLDLQKPANKPNKSANVELLKNNLDYSKLNFESLGSDEQILIIPISEKLKTLKKIGKSTIPNLVLILDGAGNIKDGNIVLFLPENTLQDNLPRNSFHNVYSSKTLDCDGKFRFLDVTGGWKYEFGYKNGKFNSYGNIEEKPETAAARSNTCINWYLVTKYYVNGLLVNETWDFVGMTCDSQCDNQEYQSLCPSDDNGVGGSENNDCCISDPNLQWSSNSISEAGTDLCGAEFVEPVTGLLTKTCVHQWDFDTNTLLWYTWKFRSYENYVLEKSGGVWRFKTVTHGSIGRLGTVPPCVNATCTINSAISSISADRISAQMDIGYTVYFNITCCALCPPKTVTAIASSSWNAQ
jgi:hypothetical protein